MGFIYKRIRHYLFIFLYVNNKQEWKTLPKALITWSDVSFFSFFQTHEFSCYTGVTRSCKPLTRNAVWHHENPNWIEQNKGDTLSACIVLVALETLFFAPRIRFYALLSIWWMNDHNLLFVGRRSPVFSSQQMLGFGGDAEVEVSEAWRWSWTACYLLKSNLCVHYIHFDEILY